MEYLLEGIFSTINSPYGYTLILIYLVLNYRSKRKRVIEKLSQRTGLDEQTIRDLKYL